MKTLNILWFLILSLSHHQLLANISLSSQGITLSTHSSHMELKPSIQFNLGQWQQAEQCRQVNFNTSRCLVGESGFIQVKLLPEQIRLEFHANKDMSVSGIGLVGQATLAGARAFLSNGVQSWSQSGVIKLPQKGVPADVLKRALEALDQKEEHRKGQELSWDHSFIQGSQESIFLGVLKSEVFRTWIQAYKQNYGEQLFISIKSGGIYDQRMIRKGAVLHSDPFHITITNDLPKELRNYAKKLTSNNTKKKAIPDIGWNSWYQHFTAVSQEDIYKSATKVPEFLQKSFAEYEIQTNKPVIYIDDGWEKEWGIWEPNRKFSKGLASIATDINKLGFQAGIWLAPLLHKKNGPIVKKNPDWFLKDQVYPHASGDYHILDVSHPQAAAFLKATIQRLVKSGFSHLKIDFLIAGLYQGSRYKDITALDAYHRTMKVIRDAAGPNTHLLACGAPLLASIEYVDSWRLGPDIAFEFPAKQKGSSWVDIANQARNISARWFLCEAIHCDADPLLLRGSIEPRFKSAAWVASLSGGGLFLSDDLSKLPIEQWAHATEEKILRQALSSLPSRPDPLVPEQLPSRLEVPTMQGRIFGNQFIKVPTKWLTPNGDTLLINFSSRPITGPDGSHLSIRASKIYEHVNTQAKIPH